MKKIISILLVITFVISIIPLGTITAFATKEQLPTMFCFGECDSVCNCGFSDKTKVNQDDGPSIAYKQYTALRTGEISVEYLDVYNNKVGDIVESGWYYKFETNSTYMYVLSDAFYRDIETDYSKLNKQLSDVFNNVDNKKAHADGNIRHGYAIRTAESHKYKKFNGYDLDEGTYTTYISWIGFAPVIDATNTHMDLQCEKYGHIVFTFKTYGVVNNFNEKITSANYNSSKISVPTKGGRSGNLVSRDVSNGTLTSFTPVFAVSTSNIKNNKMYLLKAAYSGLGIKQYDIEDAYVDIYKDEAENFLVGLADEYLTGGKIKLLKSIFSSLLSSSSDIISDMIYADYNDEGVSRDDYSLLNNHGDCSTALFISPVKLKKCDNYVWVGIDLDRKRDINENVILVEFFTFEDNVGKQYISSKNTIRIDRKQYLSGAYYKVDTGSDNPTYSNFVKFSGLKASDVQGKSVKIEGKIDNVNSQKILSHGIYLKKDSKNFSGSDIKWSSNNAKTSSTISVAQTLKNLEPNTKYYYAIYANTAYGSYMSEIKSFKTPKIKPENTSISSVKTIDYRTNKEMNSSDLGIGDTVKVKWNAAKYAEYYTIKVNGVEDKTKIYGTEKILKIDTVGTNTISICAHNEVGSSAWTAEKTATVHEDVTLSFVIPDNEGNNNAFESHTLTWNHDLPSMPVAPSRIGSTFSGWYKYGEDIHANVKNVKENAILYARYIVNTYTVKFTDNKGKEIEVTLPDGTKTKEQKVEHGEAAVAPLLEDIPVPEGFKFIGWNADYSFINDSVTIKAIIDKENYAQPVRISSAQAMRYDGRYEVICTVSNETLEHTQGRVVVALKTDAGHLITTTESTVYFVEKNDKGSDITSEDIKKKVELKILIPVDEIMDSKGLIADYVEIYAVENFKSTVPVAEHYTARVQDFDEWSAWSTANPEGQEGVGEIDSKTQYRYKDLVKTTVNTTTEKNELVAQGWTFNKTTGPETVTGKWSTTKPEAKEYRVINEKTVTDYKTVKKYCYKRYAYKINNGTNWTYGSTWATNNGYYNGKWEYKLTDKPLKEYKAYDGRMAYGSSSDFWWPADVNTKQGTDYITATTNVKVESGSHKEFQAVDKIYTYHLERWTAFSDWQDAFVEQKPDNTNDVETQTVYRYKTALPKRSSTDTTNQREDFCVGSLGKEYAGKQVTLFIYKVSEASDWTTEYVAQTVVDDEGNYFFDPYILREEPTALTGDFTVTLGIEGADGAMYLGKIKVPDSEYEYTVTFKDKDGSVIDTQVVFRGGDATAPQPPVHEGYTFSHWDMRSTDIRSNTIINAVYDPNVYDITYYDPMNETTPLVFEQRGHNADLVPPLAMDTNEFRFVGWDKVLEGVTTVKEDMVITALYEPMSYEVIFNGIDDSDEALSVQSVEYGDSPVVPELEVPEDMIFFGWQAEGDEILTEVEMLSITENTQLYPQYMFVNTTETPTADIESGSYSTAQTVKLSCETESAVIYYTTDGTDPMMSETALKYDKAKGIRISDTCQLRFIATAFNMNVSEEVTELYAINDGDETDKFLLNLEVPEWGTTAYTGIVDGGMVIADSIPEYYGYTVAGAYLEYEFNEETEELVFSKPLDISSISITKDTTIYLDYDANAYTVEFVDYDGIVLSEESVCYLSSANAPQAPERDGYVFIGWDTDDYLAVTEDIEVNAVYVPEDEYVTINLNRSSYTMMSGNSYTLSTTTGGNVENPEIIWASSDENVAVVDNNGVVTAMGKGSAEIYAIIVDNGEAAICKINVVGNPSDELTLVGKSHLAVDDYGYIRGFTVSTDTETQKHYAETVSEVKTQFANNELVFTDINGRELSDNDSVGTGTVIKIMDGDRELDSIVVVVSGDMDGDGYITNRDASRISRYLVDKEAPTEVQIAAMDVNGDGYVNNRDASVVSRYLVGKETF